MIFAFPLRWKPSLSWAAPVRSAGKCIMVAMGTTRTKQRSLKIRWGKLLIWAAAAFVLLATLAFAYQDPLTAKLATYLIDSDQLEKSDLIYLLGGDYEVRAPFAATLFHQGWAPKIVLAREPSLAGRENFTDVTAQILEKNGVPKHRIIQISPQQGVRSTADEARVLRLYLRSYPANNILAVTSSFHSRRARMALGRALIGTSATIRMAAADDPRCNIGNWQGTADGRRQVKLELVKLVYYFFTFFGL